MENWIYMTQSVFQESFGVVPACMIWKRVFKLWNVREWVHECENHGKLSICQFKDPFSYHISIFFNQILIFPVNLIFWWLASFSLTVQVPVGNGGTYFPGIFPIQLPLSPNFNSIVQFFIRSSFFLSFWYSGNCVCALSLFRHGVYFLKLSFYLSF